MAEIEILGENKQENDPGRRIADVDRRKFALPLKTVNQAVLEQKNS
jgi:hypothetical protein